MLTLIFDNALRGKCPYLYYIKLCEVEYLNNNNYFIVVVYIQDIKNDKYILEPLLRTCILISGSHTQEVLSEMSFFFFVQSNSRMHKWAVSFRNEQMCAASPSWTHSLALKTT